MAKAFAFYNMSTICYWRIRGIDLLELGWYLMCRQKKNRPAFYGRPAPRVCTLKNQSAS